MVITGRHIELYRLLSIRAGLQLEIKCPGLRMSRAGSAQGWVKKQLGFRGNKEKLLAQLDDYIRCNFPGELA